METVFIKIVNMSISAGWLVLAVIAARFLLKKAPKWISVLLWGFVSLRLMMPFTVSSGFSLLPSAEVISPSIGYAKTPAINSGISMFDNTFNPALGASLAANPGGSVNPMQIWLFVFSIVWIAGIAIMLTYGLVSCLRLRKRVSEAALLQENVWICDQVKTPFILGFLHPRIYLPSSLDEKEARYVLAHERAHLRRRDHIWKPIGFLLLSVYWFNPLMWAAYILLCRDIEMACDEKVITNMETSEKKAYANALVSCSMQRRLVLVCPLAFCEAGVKERVKGVLNYKKPSFWLITVSVAICVLVAACFLTDPGVALSRSADKVEDILVFDGNNGKWLNITDRAEIEQVVEYVSAMKLRRNKISTGYTGYRFRIAFYPSGSAQDSFILNSPDMVRKDPFFYTVVGETGLYDYLEQLYDARADAEKPYLEGYRTDYIGDAPKVSQIAMRLPYPDDYSYSSIEIHSAHEPYGLTVYLNGNQPVSQVAFEEAAAAALEYIGNMGTVRFCKAGTNEELASFERGEIESAYDRIPCVMVEGKLYLDTGKDASGLIPPTPDSSFDGTITSAVDGSELPAENGQSNFGTGYGYKIVDDKNIAVYMNQNWWLFRQDNEFSYEPEINYGSSSLYSHEDMASAIQVILAEFAAWDGCELHSLRYTSDACNSAENIAWMNDLADGRDLDGNFSQCIEFMSDFHSPVDSAAAGAWNADL